MTTPTLSLVAPRGKTVDVPCFLPGQLLKCWAWLPERKVVAAVHFALTSQDPVDAHVRGVEDLLTADGKSLSIAAIKADAVACEEAAADALDRIILGLGLLPEFREPPCSKCQWPGGRGCVQHRRPRRGTEEELGLIADARQVLGPIADMRESEEAYFRFALKAYEALKGVDPERKHVTWGSYAMSVEDPSDEHATLNSTAAMASYVSILCDQAEAWSRQRAEEQRRKATGASVETVQCKVCGRLLPVSEFGHDGKCGPEECVNDEVLDAR